MALNVLSLFCFSGRIGQWHRFVWLAPYSNFLGSRYGHTAFFPLRLLQGRAKTLLMLYIIQHYFLRKNLPSWFGK